MKSKGAQGLKKHTNKKNKTICTSKQIEKSRAKTRLHSGWLQVGFVAETSFLAEEEILLLKIKSFLCFQIFQKAIRKNSMKKL
jgi:hypothetical protein